jgi:hypothetical protein
VALAVSRLGYHLPASNRMACNGIQPEARELAQVQANRVLLAWLQVGLESFTAPHDDVHAGHLIERDAAPRINGNKLLDIAPGRRRWIDLLIANLAEHALDGRKAGLVGCCSSRILWSRSSSFTLTPLVIRCLADSPPFPMRRLAQARAYIRLAAVKGTRDSRNRPRTSPGRVAAIARRIWGDGDEPGQFMQRYSADRHEPLATPLCWIRR